MPTDSWTIPSDVPIAVSNFTAVSSVDQDFAGSPALVNIRNGLLTGGWTEIEETPAVGYFFIRDLPLKTDPPLPPELMGPPIPCSYKSVFGFHYNGTPPREMQILPFDPGSQSGPPVGCPSFVMGLTFSESLSNLIGAINLDTPFTVTNVENVAGYAHGRLLELTAKVPGPDYNWDGLWGNAWSTAVNLQPQNGGYVLRSTTYRGAYIQLTIGEDSHGPQRLWFDFQLNGGAKFRQRMNSNTGVKYRLVASPCQMLFYVPKNRMSAGSEGATFLLASIPWRPAGSLVGGSAFVTGNWDNTFEESFGSMRESLNQGYGWTAISLDGEDFTGNAGSPMISITTLHTAPATPLKNSQGFVIAQNAYVTARVNDGTFDTSQLRLLGKLWNSMVLTQHYDVTKNDEMTLASLRWMLVSSQPHFQQGSLWMQGAM